MIPKSQIVKYIKASPRVFVWSQLNAEFGVYLQINKSVILECFKELDIEGYFSFSFGEDGSLYLGDKDISKEES